MRMGSFFFLGHEDHRKIKKNLPSGFRELKLYFMPSYFENHGNHKILIVR
jgi:hypothetical protein